MIFKNSCPERGLKMKIAPSEIRKLEDGVGTIPADTLTDGLGGQVTLECLMAIGDL